MYICSIYIYIYIYICIMYLIYIIYIIHTYTCYKSYIYYIYLFICIYLYIIMYYIFAYIYILYILHGYLCPENGGNFTRTFTGKFVCIQLIILSCYGSIPLTLVLTATGGWFEYSVHSCRFDYQQRVLKTFPGPGYLYSEDGLV